MELPRSITEPMNRTPAVIKIQRFWREILENRKLQRQRIKEELIEFSSYYPVKDYPLLKNGGSLYRELFTEKSKEWKD